MTMFRGSRSAAALAVMLAFGGMASAQEAGEPARRAEARPAERPADATDRREAKASQHTDAYLAACLAIDNQSEAALAKFAQQRAESEEVRQFAEKMATEHGQMAEALQRFAQAGKSSTARPSDAARADETPRPADAPRSDAPRREEGAPAQADQPRTTQTAAAGAHGADQGAFFVNLKREIAEQCLQSAQKELGAKKGEEFDKCYINSQVMMHQHMQDTLQVFAKHAGPEFKSTIAQGLEGVKSHLEEAKAIAKKYDGKTDAELASGKN